MSRAVSDALDSSASAESLADELVRHGFGGAELALVLGSGLGAFADALDDARAVPYGELAGMPGSAVPGHAGRLVLGTLGGRRVIVQQGRVHLYEGWTPEVVTRACRAFVHLGCRAVVLTNAAGGLRPEWNPGTLMRVTDHLNLTGRAPVGVAGTMAGSPYDEELGRVLADAATRTQVPLESGVYAGLLGPTYETPAEVRMLAWMGADAVGMSTVLEAASARSAGARVAAISCITNHAAGISRVPLSHDEVMETGREAAGRFARLLEGAVPALAAASA